MKSAYFNPVMRDGKLDGYAGMFASIQGECGDHIEPSLYEFLRDAGMAYQVRRVPAGIQIGGQFDADGNVTGGNWQEATDFHVAAYDPEFGIIRQLSPGTVTAQYGCVSLMDIAGEIEHLWRDGWFIPDAVYQARGGSMDSIALRVNELEFDDFRDQDSGFGHYICFFNPYGRGGKIVIGYASTRAICENTYAMQRGEAQEFANAHELNVSHRKGKSDSDEVIRERVQQATTMCEAFREHIRILADRINRFGNTTINQAMAEEFADSLFGIDPKKKASGQSRNKRDAVLREFNMPDRGTHGANAWDLLNAVTAVASSTLTPEASKSKKNPVERIQANLEDNGSSARLVANATQALEALAAA